MGPRLVSAGHTERMSESKGHSKQAGLLSSGLEDVTRMPEPLCLCIGRLSIHTMVTYFQFVKSSAQSPCFDTSLTSCGSSGGVKCWGM